MLDGLSKEQIDLLISGLVSLEGALGALSLALPDNNIEELKMLLAQNAELLDKLQQEKMTTGEVAQALECSERYVLKLGDGKQIRLASKNRGRGCSNLYYAESVRNFLEVHGKIHNSKLGNETSSQNK